MSKKIRISEFAQICGLSADKVLLMIERGELVLVDTDSPPLKIDLSRFELQTLAQLPLSEDTTSALTLSEHESEILASELTKALESMIEEAYTLALKWQSE
jgi:hypothetical protein